MAIITLERNQVIKVGGDQEDVMSTYKQRVTKMASDGFEAAVLPSLLPNLLLFWKMHKGCELRTANYLSGVDLLGVL